MDLKIKALLITDKKGDWVVHGSSKDSPADMFKQLTNLWSFDPSTDAVTVVEFPLTLTEAETTATVHASRTE